MSTTSYVGKFCWYELLTSDPKAAEAFYTAAVGWTAKDSGMPGQSYTLLSAGEAMVGGLMAIPEQARAMGVGPCWTGYIAVDNADVFARRVTEAGGKVLRAPDEIPGVGRFAVVADPGGAGFVLFQPQGEPPQAPPPPGTPGTVGWHELHAGDLDREFGFYAGLFGWTKGDAVDMGEMGVYQIVAAGGVPIGGMMRRMPGTPGAGWRYYVNAEAIDAAAARVGRAGGRVTDGPHQVPGGSWIVQCADPQGAVFALVAPKR